jgi:hypothetical protein
MIGLEACTASNTVNIMVKPHDRLVPVSFKHCCSSTSGLSTL